MNMLIFNFIDCPAKDRGQPVAENRHAFKKTCIHLRIAICMLYICHHATYIQ